MRKNILQICAWAFVVIVVLVGCKEDPPGYGEVTQKHYVSYTEYNPAIKYEVSFIKSILETSAPELASLISHNARIFIVDYKTKFNGDSVIASGLIVTPVANTDEETFPTLCFQHGTEARTSMAPTVTVEGNQNSLPSYIACTGMIVAIPDYIGFGNTSNVFHPYMHKEYTAAAVIDFIRATKEFIGIEKVCRPSNELFLMGYSQGATAAISALEAIETDPENADITVTATSCGGGVYDLNKMVDRILKNEKYEQPFYMCYLTESFSKYTAFDVDYADIFHADIVELIPGIIDGKRSGADVNSIIGQTAITKLFTSNFRNNYLTDDKYAVMRDVLDENSIKPWDLKTPIKIYHGEKDIWVYPDQPQLLKTNFNIAGYSVSRISVTSLDDLDHAGAVYPSITNGVRWFRTMY